MHLNSEILDSTTIVVAIRFSMGSIFFPYIFTKEVGRYDNYLLVFIAEASDKT